MPGAARRLLNLPRPVWLLGWVSLATDSASEAIYPLLPYFLTTVVGGSAVSLGVIEGAAEAVNSGLKIWSGRAADRAATKRPLVLLGYAISSFVRPLIAFAQSWVHVFAVRVTDRVGKGIRGAPRDAMLATWTLPTTRGQIYGFHRAMDHTGAIVGPVLASLFLLAYPGQYRTLFGLAIIPGAIAVALIFFVRERDDPPQRVRAAAARTEIDVPLTTEEERGRSRELRHFFWVLSLFTLGNSTDAFLLLRLTDVAGGAAYIPLLWAALHVVKASVSIVGGAWSDRIGRRAVITIGWVIYAAVYLGFAVAQSMIGLVICFLIYGFYFGLTEGTEKALIADLAPAARRGAAFGIYNAVLGLGGLAASVLFGAIWTWAGPAVAFGVGAGLALLSSALLFATVRR